MTIHRILPIAVALAVTTGCVHISDHAGPIKTTTIGVDGAKAEVVRTEIHMSAGELRVEGGASRLAEGEFRYNGPFGRPTMRYDDSSFRGTLVIGTRSKEHNGIRLGNDITNEWKIKLNDKVPMEFELHMGAGEGRLNLSTFDLRRVEVHMGVGELRLDLRGKPTRDYDVEVHGGIGEATIYLPKDVGIAANAKGGIGSIHASNLREDGHRYVNDLYGKSKVNVRLDVRGGIGQINLIAE